MRVSLSTLCTYVDHSDLGYSQGTKSGPEVHPGLSTCRTDVGAEHLRDARADHALHLF